MFSHLTDGQLAVIMTFVASLGAAAGYFVKRWLSQSHVHERAALLNSLADLRAKMKSDGVGLTDITELEHVILGRGELSTESAEAVLGVDQKNPSSEDTLPNSYYTTYAMRMRAGARFDVVEAQLEEALMDLRTLISERESEELGKSTVAWKVYRKRQMSYATARYQGGTFAPLAGTLHGIEVTERRIAELINEIDARKSDPH